MLEAVMEDALGYLILALPLLSYVLHSVGLYSISKRRNLPAPWLAWVPFVCCFQLGCVADQYRLVKKGAVGHKRWALLLLGIVRTIAFIVAAYFVMYALAIGVAAIFTLGLVFADDNFVGAADAVGDYAVASVAIAWLVGLPYWITKIISRCALYRSCQPQMAGLYLALGIFLPFLNPLFVFLVRNKDDGMVPAEVNFPPCAIQ